MPNDLQLQVNQLKQQLEALQSEYYTNNFTASQDFNKYVRLNTRMKVPTLTATPSTCEIGELCVVSGTGKLYVCSATNTWTVAGTQA